MATLKLAFDMGETEGRAVFEQSTGMTVEAFAAKLGNGFTNPDIKIRGTPGFWIDIIFKSAEFETEFKIQHNKNNFLHVRHFKALRGKRKGAGKKMLGNLLHIAQSMKLDRITLNAVSEEYGTTDTDGGYFWARAGFRTQSLPQKVYDRRKNIAARKLISADALAELDRLIAGGGARIHEIARLSHTCRGKPLGEYILENTSYDAYLNLDDQEAVGRVEAFVAGPGPSVPGRRRGLQAFSRSKAP